MRNFNLKPVFSKMGINVETNFRLKENTPIIGIIGGVGPFAGLDFAKKVFSSTNALQDQDHLDCILASCPSAIPDRTEFLLKNKAFALNTATNTMDNRENPAFGMLECAGRLYAAGARIAAVACNTAHASLIFSLFIAMARESFPDLQIVNMLETAAAFVKKNLAPCEIGLLATLGTHASGVYHEYFHAEDGFSLLEPDDSGKKKVHDAIYNREYGIKACSEQVSLRAQEQIGDEIMKLLDRGAKALILGCTELPLAVKSKNFPVALIDPGLLTARRLVELAAPEKLLPMDEGEA